LLRLVSVGFRGDFVESIYEGQVGVQQLSPPNQVQATAGISAAATGKVSLHLRCDRPLGMVFRLVYDGDGNRVSQLRMRGGFSARLAFLSSSFGGKIS
jgi:hypothetical protein